MTTEPENEGELVYESLFGLGPRPRATAPEPSLLPHLAAYLCHDFSIEQVLSLAFRLGCEGATSPPWPALWEATLWGACSRPRIVTHLRDFDGAPAALLDIGELAHNRDPARGRQLFEQALDQADALGNLFPPNAAAARLLRYVEPAEIQGWLKDPRFDPGELDAESVRALLEAMSVAAIVPDDDWLERATQGAGVSEYGWSRIGHLLPHLPPAMRAAHADEMAGDLCWKVMAPDARALVISRIAPFVSSPGLFDLSELRAMEPAWAQHVDGLIGAPWPAEPWGDVFRAHPEHAFFRDVVRPHESTASTAGEIESRWGAKPLEAAAPPTRGGDTAPPSPPPPPAPEPAPAPPAPGAPPDRPITIRGEPEYESPGDKASTPRALQADVSVKGDAQVLDAFVAGAEHDVVVSIGRGARVRADRVIDETVFDNTDAPILQLPVYLVADGQMQKGTLWLPRDRSANSTTERFSVTAPASGRVTARVHVMRPDGRALLESAFLIGDVVDEKTTAQGYERPIELTTDVIAGDVFDPTSSGPGATVISDARDAQATGDAGEGLVNIDVAALQEKLGGLVCEIELAAERQDVDDTIVERKLVELAIAGQSLRSLFDASLEKLQEEDTLQIVSLRHGDVLPLELVYDGPRLSSSSEICPTWRDALRDGHCDSCAAAGEAGDAGPAKVCPLNFWSMHKVIERRTADAQGGNFRVGSEPSAARPRLRPVDAVIVGASGKLTGAQVEALRERANDAFGVPAGRAADWAQWRDLIKVATPELLVAMPHDQPIAGGHSSALMLGEPTDKSPPPPSTELLSGGVTEEEVLGDEARPGPIVLLLGCNTMFMDGRLASFAGEFRENGAALTVATLGRLVVDQAPHAARILIDYLAKPPGGATTVGEVMLRARQQLLSEGMIMALLLVANGDANWQLPE